MYFSFIFTCDPVNSDALHPADAGRDDVLPPRLVALGPRDPVQAHVGPVDGVVGCGDARPRVNGKGADGHSCQMSDSNKQAHERDIFTATWPISPNVIPGDHKKRRVC